MGTDADEETDETASPEESVQADEAMPSTPSSEISDDEQTWAILTHASGLLGLVVPFGNIFGPLLCWLIWREESAFVDESGRAALNFQLTWTLWLFLAILSLVVGIGLVLIPAVALAWLVLVVVATARASDREVYEYPLTIDFVE